MAFPPTRAAYEALINEVKLLKEENKQLRNEIKETSRSTLEVELETETRDRKASRNSWAEIYHNNTVRRKSVKLLGQDVAMDEWLDWRVKWAQRGVGKLIFNQPFDRFDNVTGKLVPITFYIQS